MISKYYGSDVLVLISMKIDTSMADAVASLLVKFEEVEEVFLVTGDIDLVAKARFKDYGAMRDFILKSLSKIVGIRETKTMVVVTVFK
ncbi:MAG: Lrp/AsnC ligand binding domain-containing protein [Candidatus Dadabacteria bacterium]|nr:Lrp/AsnC ligand binding domain-containing protein [Candidatus Dadabacteria bacterium]